MSENMCVKPPCMSFVTGLIFLRYFKLLTFYHKPPYLSIIISLDFGFLVPLRSTWKPNFRTNTHKSLLSGMWTIKVSTFTLDILFLSSRCSRLFVLPYETHHSGKWLRWFGNCSVSFIIFAFDSIYRSFHSPIFITRFPRFDWYQWGDW